MAFSGHILEEVLQRRLQEEIRLQQERKQAEELALRRQEMQNVQEERLAQRKFQQDMLDRADAAQIDAETEQGPISEETATALGKSPITKARVGRRQIIDAKPIAAQSVLPGSIDPEPAGDVGPGLPVIDAAPRRSMAPTMIGGDVMASTDTSGPQNYPVRMPTRMEAEKQLRTVNLQQLGKQLRSDPDADARISRMLENPDLAKDVPNYAVEQTPGERAKSDRLKATEANELANKTWTDRNAIEHRQRLQEIGAQGDQQLRIAQAAEEAKARAAKGDPEAKKMLRNMALDAATKLRRSPGLKDFTGWKGAAYAFGALDEPMEGTAAATAKPFYDSMISLLAAENLPLLKGPMSDKDILFIKSMSAMLQPGMQDEAFVAALDEIIQRLKNPTGEGWGSESMRPDEAGPAEPFGVGSARGLSTPLQDKVNRRRGQR